MYTCSDQKGNSFEKKIASFCVAMFHPKFGRFWSESIVEE